MCDPIGEISNNKARTLFKQHVLNVVQVKDAINYQDRKAVTRIIAGDQCILFGLISKAVSSLIWFDTY